MKKAFIKKRVVFATALSLMLVTAFQLGCENHQPVGADGREGSGRSPVVNEPPQTYLTIPVPEGQMPDTTTSKKQVSWWGEDPDGRVVSYFYRWGQLDVLAADSSIIDTLWYDADWQPASDTTWISTDQEKLDFVLPIRTEYAVFTLQVKAVDNSGAVDPEPAAISFPVVNSRPSIDFRLTSNPIRLHNRIYTTFPVRSFVWDATDPDGNETIASILYALDPQPEDTNWVEIDGTENSVTLRDLSVGDHIFWVKARDIAGFDSSPIHFPDSTSDTDPREWQVKAPAGDYLIVNDYAVDSEDADQVWYSEIFTDLYGPEGEGFSVWKIGEELPYVSADVTETLQMFHRVLWYSYFGQPLLTRAFNSMYSFINTPGNRMLLTTSTVDTGMVLDLAYPDSLNIVASRLISRDDDPVILNPGAGTGLPTLEVGLLIGLPVKAFVPTESAEVIYRLDPSTHQPTPQYEGEPIVGVRRPDKSYTLISIPLRQIDDQAQVGEVIRVTFDE